jgi:hypothetical protein
MPTDRLPVLVAGAFAGAFALGKLVLARPPDAAAPADVTPADTKAANPDPFLSDSATIDFPGVLEGVYPSVDQFGNPVSPPSGVVTPPNPLPTTPTPTPTPTPAPTSTLPAFLPTRPAGAVGWVQASGLKRLFSVSGGVAKQITYASVNVSAWVGPAVHYPPNATLRKILSGGHIGAYVATTDVTFHPA